MPKVGNGGRNLAADPFSGIWPYLFGKYRRVDT